jgi:magnesium transporter
MRSPGAFAMFVQRASRPAGCGTTGQDILAGLIETVIDRAADVLQMMGDRIDAISRNVFEERTDPSQRNAELQGTLRALGRLGDLSRLVLPTPRMGCLASLS